MGYFDTSIILLHGKFGHFENTWISNFDKNENVVQFVLGKNGILL